MDNRRGYTLVELMVALGLFAIIMLLASGAYLMMISLSREAQGMATGIDNLSFVIETMTRDIRTGSAYNCNAAGDCAAGGTTFAFTSYTGATISYQLSNGAIQETINGSTKTLTDPAVVISSLMFYAYGTARGDALQPHVTIIVSGSVNYGANKTQTFNIETGATMRGTDL